MFSSSQKKLLDVQTTSFTEILLIILFILIVYNFKSIETIDIKEKKILELVEQNSILKQKVDKQDKEIKSLKKEIKLLKEEILYWRKSASSKLGELIGKNFELLKKVKEYEKKNEKKGTKKSDKAVNFCRVDGKDIFALEIFATKSYYEITPLWNISHNSFISQIPGLNQLSQKTRVSRSKFRNLFGKTYRWGNEQDPKCRFKVKLYFDKTNMSINQYDDLLHEVDRHFWKARIK